MSKTVEPEEIMTAIDMADYFAHKNYNDLLKGSILGQLNIMGVTLDALPAHLRERIEFFGFRQMLLTTPRSELKDLLQNFDELAKQWGETVDKSGVPLLQWQTWRYKIVMQMGLDILRSYLKLPSFHEAFVRPDSIELPADFDFEQYKQSLALMMKDVSEHGRKNTVAAKTEHMHADMVQKALLDILTDTGKLFSYKLFYIFNGNTISHFRRELGSFIDEIESLCLAPPKILQKPFAMISPTEARNSNNEEWGLKDREARGPYGVPAPAASVQPVTATTPSKTGIIPSSTGAETSDQKLVRTAKNAKNELTQFSTKVTRSRVRDIAESGHSNAAVAKDNGRKKRKVEPVTEAFTQFEQGFDVVSNDADSDKDQNELRDSSPSALQIPMTRGAAAACEELRSASEQLKRKQKDKDPLLELMGESPSPVVSRAVSSKRTQMSPLTESPVPEKPSSSRKKSHIVKKSVIGARDSAEEVTFDDTESDKSVALRGNLPPGKRLTAIKAKENFPKSIEREEVARPAPGGAQKRIAWSIEEEDALVTGINRHGFGKWKAILNDPTLAGKFRNRTNIQLKDKHRNMVNAGYTFEE